MKNYSKIISVLLTIAILATIAVIPGSALATEITAGNTKETATNIPQYGIDYVSSLSKAEEVDWFKFTTLSEDAFYNVYFENYNLANTDSWSVNSDYSPHLYLYDENMKQLEWCYTGGDRTGSFNLKLESSTEYYIKILMGKEKKDSIGNYQITISAKLDNIPDTLEESSKIQLNTKIVSSLDGYPDTDWFSFTTGSSDEEYTIHFVNYDLPNTSSWSVNRDYSPNIDMYDKYMQTIASDYTRGNKETTFKVALEANTTYYVKIYMGSGKLGSVGNYEFTVSSDNTDSPIAPPVTTKTLSSISVDTLPAKIQYTVGEELDTTGMVVRAKYSDGTSAVVTNYEVYGFDLSKAGTSVVRVSYSEGGVTKTAAFSVVINESTDQTPDDNSNSSFSFDSIIEFFDGILAFFAQILEWIIDLLSSLA
ncbi:MAG: bacterial Ig-like domain-containing protein [Clostridia bacterium]|nr:bacterial Ig-like domain-containing protein [Clostridia bacterium]